MKAKEFANLNGDWLTFPQAQEMSNLGYATVKRIATESGAYVKVGHVSRIHRQTFNNYLLREYKAVN